jgi:acetyltransferase-like isoleucine patch superfamily enzyme
MMNKPEIKKVAIRDVKFGINVVIGTGSVVTKDILHPGIYAGNPAQKLRGIE